MSPARISPRRTLAVAVAAAVLAALAIGSIASLAPANAARATAGGATASPAMPAPAAQGALTGKQVAFHDAMRGLWESHGTWTERAIVDFVGDLPDTQLVVARLLRNQTDIGNAVKPYYGTKAGNELTALLKGHIKAAVAVLAAAKSGDAAAVATAKKAFYANGNQVARFLHSANPHHWALGTMQTMMRIHLNQVVALAVDQLEGHYAAAITLYDVYIGHILDMADMLSTGIMQQFPTRFH
jgi:hypothetical protein